MMSLNERERKLISWVGLLAVGFLGISENLYDKPLWWVVVAFFASGVAAGSNVPQIKKWGGRLFILLATIAFIAGVGLQLYKTSDWEIKVLQWGGKVLQWGGYLLLAVVIFYLLEYVLRKAGFKPKPPHEQGDGSKADGVAHKTEPMHYKLPHEQGDESKADEKSGAGGYGNLGFGVIFGVVYVIYLKGGFSWLGVTDKDWFFYGLVVVLALASTAYSFYKGKHKGMMKHMRKKGLPKEPGDDSDVKNEYQHWHREK